MKVDQIADILERAGAVERGADGASFNEVETHRELQVRESTPPSRHEVESAGEDRLRSAVDGKLADGTELSPIGRTMAMPPPPPPPIDPRAVVAAQRQLAPALAEYQQLIAAADELERRRDYGRSALVRQKANDLAQAIGPEVTQTQRAIAAMQQHAFMVARYEAARRLVDKHPWIVDGTKWQRCLRWATKHYGVSEAEIYSSVDETLIDTALSLYESTHNLGPPTKDGLRQFGEKMRRARVTSEAKRQRTEGPMSREAQVAAVSRLLRGA